MLLVYNYFKYFNSFGAGIVFRRQNLTSSDVDLTYKDGPRTEGVKAINYLIHIVTHLKLCLANATHNFKWIKITHIYSI